jgi:CDP-paratose 2-epimerase
VSVVIVTGSAGLIGSEASAHFARQGRLVVGIDSNMRQQFFGAEASTEWNRLFLERTLGKSYRHVNLDIRDTEGVDRLFAEYAGAIGLVIHTAAQPSHDWAAQDPQTDFTVNANGTLSLLQATRKHAPEAAFVYTSTNKVYGDTPNSLPLHEESTRWEIDPEHPYSVGISESMSVDQTLHSLFGCSKLAADVMVQEYGRYFGLHTACFRGGCLTGPNHSGTKLHGFLAYLMKCAVMGTPYTVFGYGGKQVRDNIHSADLIAAFEAFSRSPGVGEVYNIGGGRFSNCSMIEAIELCAELTGRPLQWTYSETNRVGDHMWWISDTSRFEAHYPAWRLVYNVPAILKDIHDHNNERWSSGADLAQA